MHKGKSVKKGAVTSPFKDAVYGAEKSPAQSIIDLAGDAGMPLAIGIKVGSEPASALDYIKKISR